MSLIHLALVDAYPTETDARTDDEVPDGAAYHGVWRVPQPYGGIVHVFGEISVENLEQRGWERA